MAPEVKQLIGDVSDSCSFNQLSSDFDLIFYCVAPDSREQSDYKKVYCQGLSNTVNFAQSKQPNPRIVYSSSTGVYGQSAGEEVNEETPLQLETPRSEILFQAEKILTNYSGKGVSARLSGIYGPGRGSLVQKALRATESPDNQGSFTNRVHVHDAARAMIYLARLAEPEPTYIVTDSKPVTRIEVYNWIRSCSGLEKLTQPPTNGTPTGKRCSNQRLLKSGFLLNYEDYQSGYSRAELKNSYLQQSV